LYTIKYNLSYGKVIRLLSKEKPALILRYDGAGGMVAIREDIMREEGVNNEYEFTPADKDILSYDDWEII